MESNNNWVDPSDISKLEENYLFVTTPVTRKFTRENDPDKWELSIKSEFDSIKDNKVYESMDKYSLTAEEQRNLVPIRLLFCIKEDGRRKTRAVALGNRSDDSEMSVYSPVPRWPNLRTILKVIANSDLATRQFDIKTAFLYAELEDGDKPIHCIPPAEWRTHKNEIWRLRKALYGLKSAPFLFYRTLSKVLLAEGWQQSKEEPCLFFRGRVSVLIYVDDLLFFGPSNEAIDEVKDTVLKGRYELFDGVNSR